MTRGGPLVLLKPGHRLSFNFGSDSRNMLSLSCKSDLIRNNTGSKDISLSGELKFRPASYLNMVLAAGADKVEETEQYVSVVDDETAEKTFGRRYIFSELKGTENWISGRFEWTVTPDFTLQIISRPLITAYNYYNMKEFVKPKTHIFNSYGSDIGDINIDDSGDYTIDPDGVGTASSFNISNPDFNYHALQTTAVVRWEFKPGSILYFVWQQDKRKYSGGSSAHSALDMLKDYKSLFSANAANTFRVKLVYWFDR
jgi:hypothetical protein